MKALTRLMAILLVVVFASGCADITFSAHGGSGALLKVFSDLRTMGKLSQTPGGFVARNRDPGLGVLINEDRAEEKDIDIYVRRGPGYDGWVLYRGPAIVWTPEGPRKIQGLESIHMDTPFMRRVTLRCRDPKTGTVREISFSTAGTCDSYGRENVLLISLPVDWYRLEVYSYTGSWIFESAKGRPRTRHIYMDDDPCDYRVGNTWVGWSERL